MKATNSGEPCQRVVAWAGNPSSPKNEHPDGLRRHGGKAERANGGLYPPYMARPGGLASQFGKTGWREFFASNPCLQASQ
jgi:hypothetical protein